MVYRKQMSHVSIKRPHGIRFDPDNETINKYIRRLQAYESFVDRSKYHLLLDFFREALKPITPNYQKLNALTQVRFKLSLLNQKRLLTDPDSSPLIDTFYQYSGMFMWEFGLTIPLMMTIRTNDAEVLKLLKKFVLQIGYTLYIKKYDNDIHVNIVGKKILT